MSRDQYAGGYQPPISRAQPIDHFSGRLFKIERQGPRDEYNELLRRIAGSALDWSIDQLDSGQYFLKVRKGNGSHSSDGLGEGTVSLLFLADALYDSAPGDTIVIDEPELSLHPIHQRRLRRELSRFAADRQIVLATHSPYFIEWSDLLAGGSIYRIHLNRAGHSTVSTAQRSTLGALGGLVLDVQNPHVLGLNASEVFFLEDGVIVTEGQEDVVCYQAMADQLGMILEGEFFGWGVGGAAKMPLLVQLLADLGYSSVAGILDGNRSAEADNLRSKFPAFTFHVIPTADVRTKPARPPVAGVAGLADQGCRLLPEHRDAVIKLFDEVNSGLARPSTGTP